MFYNFLPLKICKENAVECQKLVTSKNIAKEPLLQINNCDLSFGEMRNKMVMLQCCIK